jgi:dihydropteroate synthase
VALTTLAGLLGVWAVRVHEARASVDALKVVARWHDLGTNHRFGPSDAAGKVIEDE